MCRIFFANGKSEGMQAFIHPSIHPPVYPSCHARRYWTDAGSFEIRRCKPDGSSAEVLYNKTVVLLPNSQPSNKPVQQLTGLLDPQGIAVDSVAGKVYWTQLGTQYKTRGGPSVQRNSKLQRANLDGSEIETLAEFGASQPVAVAISLVPSHKAEL